ncbi:MAG TPA: nitronate monooxygenase [Victivallales bacterium]|nr:nitronate monooxygenase [Victivallales bacterium]
MANLSDRLYKRGSEFLNVKYPIICGAMTWVSEPKLVSAVANAGGFGCLAGGNTPPDILKAQIEETRKLTDNPIAVNIITIAPAYQDHLELVKDLKLPYIIFAGGFPNRDEIKAAKNTGAKVICFASTASIAKRMVKFGADAIVLEGMEAGGHVGHVSLIVLLQQVLFEINEVPVFVGGGLATGKMCAHMLMMGASGVQLGTRFAMAEECLAHPKFKEKFIHANARDAISTPQYDSRLPVVAVRALRNKGMEDFGRLQLDLLKQLDKGEISRNDAQFKVEEYWMGGLRSAVVDGNIETGSLMAGQSVGLIKKPETVDEIFGELLTNIEKELQRVKTELN